MRPVFRKDKSNPGVKGVRETLCTCAAALASQDRRWQVCRFGYTATPIQHFHDVRTTWLLFLLSVRSAKQPLVKAVEVLNGAVSSLGGTCMYLVCAVLRQNAVSVQEPFC